MVPEEDQHHRPVQLLQSLGQLDHGLDGGVHPLEIVVPDVAALCGHAGVGGGEILHPGGIGRLVGTVVLIGHGEGEAGALCRALGQLGEQLQDQNVVRVVDGAGGVYQRTIVVLGEPAVLKAQIVVHVLPVIEPAVPRVAEKGLIALVPEIPHIGVGVPAEVVVLGVAGQKAPLAVHRAPGKDVGQQPAGHPLLRQRVPGVIHPGSVRVAGHKVKIGQVAEGLQHDAHHGHLLVRRDVRIGERPQQGLGLGPVIARGRGRKHVPHTVQKGVQTALGHKDLHVGPGVDILGIVRGLI